MVTVTLPATPTKLRSGAWGARVSGDASVGDIVEITTRAGKRWTATVTAVEVSLRTAAGEEGWRVREAVDDCIANLPPAEI